MKLAFRVTIICVCLLLLITSIFGGCEFLTAFSYLERPVPGNWKLPNPWLPTRPPHLGLRMPMMIISGVGPTLTGVKARSIPRRPPRPVPPFLRSLVQAYPCHHLIRPVSICTHCPLWRLWRHEAHLGRPPRRLGTFTTRLEQKMCITPAPLRTARPSRASESRCNFYSSGHLIPSLCCAPCSPTESPRTLSFSRAR